MIYLIGGSPRSGKTVLSKKLSEKLAVPYISTDVLRLFMVASLKHDDKYSYFPFEKMFDLSGSVDKFYKENSGDNILSADLEEAKNLMPGINAFIDYLKKSDLNYIIEGVHFLPSLIANLKGDEGIKIIMLFKKDSNKIYQGLKENRGKGDWIADNIKDDQILSSAAKSISQYGEYFENESVKHNLNCINTEDNFFDKIEDAINYLE